MSAELSYWERASFFNYDVVIIGSGLVGLNAAIHTQKINPSLSIAILESGFLPSGASTKNAGFACFGSISELMEQEHICGSQGLSILIEKRWKGLLKLRKLLGDKAINYENFGGYELLKDSDPELSEKCVSKIEHFNKLVASIVGGSAFSLVNKRITPLRFNGISNLIVNQYEAQIDTGKMMFSLLQHAKQLGVFIFNSCEVTRIESEKNGVSVHTNNGLFYAKKIIVTTNAFVKSLLPELDVTPGRGQVLITKPIKNLKIKGTFHYDKGYYYFRNVGDRILLGGGRNLDFKTEETTSFGQTPLVQQALERLLGEVILPGVPLEIEQRWSGIMAFGKHLEPIITEAKPNVFCAVRCNGMGIAMGAQTGEDVAEMMLNSLV